MSRPAPMRFQADVTFDPNAPVQKKWKLKLKKSNYFQHYLPRFKGPVTIEIRTARKVRSYKANRRYWGAVVGTALEEAEEFTGHTKDELHEIFKQRYLTPKIVTYAGKQYPLWSTRTLTDGEFVEYCMKIEQDLAEMGVKVPTPSEHYAGI